MNPLRQQIRSMLRVETRETGFRAIFNVDADLMVLPDHFPGNPILPGICMMQAILVAGATAKGLEDLKLVRLKNAKMMQPVQPGDQVIIEAEVSESGGELAIKSKLLVGDQKRAEFSLVASPIRARSPAAV